MEESVVDSRDLIAEASPTEEGYHRVTQSVLSVSTKVELAIAAE